MQGNATYKQILRENHVIDASFLASAMFMKYTGHQAPGDTMPSPCSSAFYTPSVADSVEFTETNPVGIDAIGQEAPAIGQEASAIDKMNDTESESEGGEICTGGDISTGGNFALFMAQVCL